MGQGTTPSAVFERDSLYWPAAVSRLPWFSNSSSISTLFLQACECLAVKVFSLLALVPKSWFSRLQKTDLPLSELHAKQDLVKCVVFQRVYSVYQSFKERFLLDSEQCVPPSHSTPSMPGFGTSRAFLSDSL